MKNDPFSFKGDACPDDSQPISTSSTYYLTEKEILNLEKQTKTGDSKSAFRLHLYYLFSNENSLEAEKWLAKSAELGSAVAQYNLSIGLCETDKEQAKIWAERAAENGNESAKLLLIKLKSAGSDPAE